MRYFKDETLPLLIMLFVVVGFTFVLFKVLTANKNVETYCAKYDTRAVYVYSTGRYEFADVCIDEVVFIDRTGE